MEPDKAKEILDHVNDARAQYAKRGFVASFGAWYSYINAVGVAFRPTDGSQLVALTCGGIVDILPREKCLKEVGPALVQLTKRMHARLKGKPDPEPAPRKRPD
jgi:DNA-binding IclR family transcriptional regulator